MRLSREVVERIVKLAQTVEAERGEPQDGPRAVGDIMADIMLRLKETGCLYPPAEMALRRALMALPHDDLVMVGTVMLIGRDGSTVSLESEPHGGLAGYIADKRDLAGYLLAGLATLTTEDIAS